MKITKLTDELLKIKIKWILDYQIVNTNYLITEIFNSENKSVYLPVFMFVRKSSSVRDLFLRNFVKNGAGLSLIFEEIIDEKN